MANPHRAAVLFAFVCLTSETTSGCCRRRPAPAFETELESVPVVIDDAYIAAHDAHEVLEPVWWKGNIYGTPADYEASLSAFSVHQRRLFAIEWYEAEVNNGGHDQFYSNSTGIVWRDARAGLSDLGLEEGIAILDESAKADRGGTIARQEGTVGTDRASTSEVRRPGQAILCLHFVSAPAQGHDDVHSHPLRNLRAESVRSGTFMSTDGTPETSRASRPPTTCSTRRRHPGPATVPA